jgi:hypothetical protein
MITITRRQTVLGGCLCVGLLSQHSITCRADDQSEPVGCCLTDLQASRLFTRTTGSVYLAKGDQNIVLHSGRPELDYALAQGLGKIAETFDVLPGFAFYNDEDSHNAFATESVLLKRSDGTVLFGLHLLDELLGLQESRDAAIMSVCAHEFGHIVAYKTEIYDTLCPDRNHPFRSEQFADFMAGYFAGLRKTKNPQYQAVVFATTLYSYGGQLRGSHGTEDERGQAVAEGFKASFEQKLSLSAAIAAGLKFAMSRG